MSEMKTLKFPGDAEPREIVDERAREQISSLSKEISGINSGQPETACIWKGKTLNFMGDSITEGYGSTENYVDLLSELLGAACNNYGIGGSTVAEGENPMYARVLTMDAAADLCLVFGGTNDFANYNRVLGEQFIIDDTGTRTLNVDANTFYGALNQMCINLYIRFPYSTLVLCTPIHRKDFSGQKTDLQPNAVGLYLDDYVDAIKKVSAYFSIPCLDLYAKSNLYPYNTENMTQYFSESDQLHPNANGHRQLAKVMMEFLKTLPDKRSEDSGEITDTEDPGEATDVNVEYSASDMSGVMEVVEGFYDRGGGFIASPYENVEYLSWKIPCKAGDTFVQYSNSKYGMYKSYFDADGTFIETAVPADGSPTTFTVPDNTAIAYMWAAVRKSDVDDGSYKLIKNPS